MSAPKLGAGGATTGALRNGDTQETSPETTWRRLHARSGNRAGARRFLRFQGAAADLGDIAVWHGLCYTFGRSCGSDGVDGASMGSRSRTAGNALTRCFVGGTLFVLAIGCARPPASEHPRTSQKPASVPIFPDAAAPLPAEPTVAQRADAPQPPSDGLPDDLMCTNIAAAANVVMGVVQACRQDDKRCPGILTTATVTAAVFGDAVVGDTVEICCVGCENPHESGSRLIAFLGASPKRGGSGGTWTVANPFGMGPYSVEAEKQIRRLIRSGACQTQR